MQRSQHRSCDPGTVAAAIPWKQHKCRVMSEGPVALRSPEPPGCVPYLGVTTLSPRVLRRNDRYLQGLPPCRVFAPGIAANANQPIVALLLHPKNHPLRVYGRDHHRQRRCVVATIPKRARASIADNPQPATSTDIAPPLEATTRIT